MSGLDSSGNPVCQPLDCLRDIINWTADKFRFHEQPARRWSHEITQHKRTSHANGRRPQVLVCHDMKGGYLDDRLAQGGDDPTAYRFYHWHLIDTFIYFSHRFVTIPPVGWISAAHKHGVQILGTIITEWDDGAQICKELLASKETIDLVTAKLADIAFVFGFDGWLVNIENIVSEESIPDLEYFVQQLTAQCHSHLKDAKVLWYDSVTRCGDLSWQNELNDENKMFFSACDGIFLNYAITDATLANSFEMAQTANRCFDVYVGVDVFGRATPGGGGFNCKQVLEMISTHGLSCALFAHGWVYEKHGAEAFDANEIKFWELLKDLLPLRTVDVPFSTSFCQGYGKKFYLEGKVISEKPWHNLSLQQIQPCCFDNNGVFLTTCDAYNGGGCLRIASEPKDNGLSITRLFNIALDQKGSLILSAIWKNCELSDQNSGLAFVLQISKDSGVSSVKTVVLTNDEYGVMDEDIWSLSLNIDASQAETWKESVRFVNATHLDEADRSDWKTSQWDIDVSGLPIDANDHPQVILSAVSVLQGKKSDHDQKEKFILLGNLQVQWKSSSENCLFQPTLSSLICLAVKIVEPMTKDSVSTLASNLEDLRRLAKCELDGSATATCQSFTQQDIRCIFKSCQVAPTGSEAQPYFLYILNWMCRNDNSVDYYMIFCKDEKGLEHFVGCSSGNSFVYKHNSDGEMNAMVFSILPLMKYTSLPGQKFSFPVP